MRKAVIVIMLLGALVIISYLKTDLSQERINEAKTEALKAGQGEITQLEADLEELNSELSNFQKMMTDSLSGASAEYTTIIDSLKNEIADREDQIEQLMEKNTTLSQQKSSKETTDKYAARQEDIIKHFKAAVAKLPGDLTTYEKQVAFKEIKQETARKYSISLDQLESMTKNLKLE